MNETIQAWIEKNSDKIIDVVAAIQEHFEKMTLGEREFLQMDACFRHNLKKS